MINLFQLASNDQSIVYLGQLFGYVGSVLPVQNPQILVGMLFKILNTTALTIGAILVVYVTVVGLLKTAQEGEFLGRQWNSLWVPIRTVMGIAALFPTASGYSAIQVIIMWVVLQGVGAGDTVWTKVVQYIGVAGSPYSAVNSDSLNTIQTEPLMQQLFQGLMCQASAKATYAPTPTMGAPVQYYCEKQDNDRAFCTRNDSDMLNPVEGGQASEVPGQKSVDPVPASPGKSAVPAKAAIPGKGVYAMGPGGRCGLVSYCDQKTLCTADSNSPKLGPDTADCLACKAQRAALQTIVPTLGGIASKLVAMDHDYVQFYEVPMDPANATDWMKDYCSANNIPPDQCCRKSLPNPGGFGKATPENPDGETSLYTCANSFPYDKPTDTSSYMNTSSSQKVSTSTGANSATDLYLKYPMATFLNGADFINAALGEYQAALIGAVSSYIQSQMSKTPLTDWQLTASNDGWILAGIFYYSMANGNQKPQNAGNPLFTVELGSLSAGPPPVLTNYRINRDAVGNMLMAMKSANSSSPSFTNMPGGAGNVESALGGANANLLRTWMANLRGEGDVLGQKATNPLISLAAFGFNMMTIAQVLFVVLTGAAFAMGVVSSISPIVFGNGITMNPFGEGLKALLNLVGPFFVILIVALFSIGSVLGIYVPFIPFMIFTLGAIGWLIAVVEIMVAAPIIALGILSPGGQHDILGRAEPALMQLFNIFLRPSLMVIGLMISMYMAVIVVKLVNAGFMAVVASVVTTPGMFEQIIYIAIYTSFIVTVLNKAFSLIYVIPEKVLTYIGGPAVAYGEEQSMQAGKHAAEAATSTVSGAGKEAGGSARHSGEGLARATNTKEAKEKQDKDELDKKNVGGASVKAENNGGNQNAL